jgi:hypothetical protein
MTPRSASQPAELHLLIPPSTLRPSKLHRANPPSTLRPSKLHRAIPSSTPPTSRLWLHRCPPRRLTWLCHCRSPQRSQRHRYRRHLRRCQLRHRFLTSIALSTARR